MHSDFNNVTYEVIKQRDLQMNHDLASFRMAMIKEFGRAETDATFHVFAALHKGGDISQVTREVFHWVYFKTHRRAERFAIAVSDQGYKVFSVAQISPSSVLVKFSHIGLATLKAIFAHKKEIFKQAKSERGVYDGWETSIEHDQPSQATMERNFHTRFADDITVMPQTLHVTR